MRDVWNQQHALLHGFAFEDTAPFHNTESTALKYRKLPTPARRNAAVDNASEIYDDIYEKASIYNKRTTRCSTIWLLVDAQIRYRV